MSDTTVQNNYAVQFRSQLGHTITRYFVHLAEAEDFMHKVDRNQTDGGEIAMYEHENPGPNNSGRNTDWWHVRSVVTLPGKTSSRSIELNDADEDYGWCECHGHDSSCRNTVKFGPDGTETVCPACGAVYVREGDRGVATGEVKLDDEWD